MTSIVIVGALLVVPGIGAALAFAPPDGTPIETRLALVVGLGYALEAGLAMTLALAHVLSRATFIIGVILVTLAVWALAFRRASPRAYASAIRAQALEAPFTLASGLIVLSAFALTWPLYPAQNNLAKHAPWRYWADGLEVAAAGHVPPTTNQWGAELPTAVDKVVLDAFEGGVSFLIGPSPLAAMRAILTLTAIGLAAALLGLGRELGLRAFAPLVPAFVLLFPGRLPIAEEVAGDLSAYKAENVGRLVALTALLVGIYAVAKARSSVLAVLAGGIFALGALTHGISAVVALATLGLYVIGALLVDRTYWRRTVAMGVVIFLVAGVGYGAMLGLSGGDLGFQRVTSGPAVAGFPSDIDPARSFDRAEVVRKRPKEGRFLIPPSTVAKRYAKTTIGSGANASDTDAAHGGLTLLLLAVATVVVVLVASWLLPLAVVAWGLSATLVCGALFFSYRYDTKIPGDFGVRRLYDYAVLPPALIVPAVIEVFALWVSRRRPFLLAALSLVTAALAFVAAFDRIPGQDPGGRPAKGLAAIDRVAETVPCGARMLPNARSAGAWEAMTGRRSIIEGLAPYLRPEVTKRVLPTVIGAKQFFHDPKAHRNFLAREQVDYIVVLRPGRKTGSLHPFPTDVDAIASLRGVHEISESGGVEIFAVGPTGTTATAAQPRRCPI